MSIDTNAAEYNILIPTPAAEVNSSILYTPPNANVAIENAEAVLVDDGFVSEDTWREIAEFAGSTELRLNLT